MLVLTVPRSAVAAPRRNQRFRHTKLAGSLSHDTPIYTWRPDELRYGGVQYVPTAIRTSAAGLSIHLEPLRDGRL